MTKLERDAAWRRRKAVAIAAQLDAIVGARCALCGATEALHYDHEHGRTWEPCRLRRMERLARYLVEARAGLVRRLCEGCNCADGARRKAALSRAMAEGLVFEDVGTFATLGEVLACCRDFAAPLLRVELEADGRYRGAVLVAPGTVAPF